MRIALLTPTYWPEVRRGSERVIHDLGVTLAGRGHDVTLLTRHAGRPVTRDEDGVRVERATRLPELPGLKPYEYHVLNVPAVFARLRRDRFDLVHSFFPSESWAAVQARRRGGPPVVASTHGIPTREYLVARRYRLDMHLEIARYADGVSVLSEAAARAYRRYLLRDPAILPGGVIPEAFATDLKRGEPPTIFCAASLGDPRKRAGLLFGAFAKLREQQPDARLQIAATLDPFMSGLVPELPDGAEWIDVAAPGALARAYAAARVSVNPAVGEAFGLVLIESLAAGTPVVADTSGAAPEIVSQAVGRLFTPDDEDDLASALLEGLALGAGDATAAVCRERAAAFSWDEIVERYEEVYARVI